MISISEEIQNFFSIKNFEKSRRFAAGQYTLDNIKRTLSDLGNPQLKFKTIHIAGTIAKGSTATYLQRMLVKHGLNTGLYTSPHLVSLHERIIINNQMISDEQLQTIWQELKQRTDVDSLSFFDALTVLAFLFFEKQKVDYAIIETGLGGRLDSTNTVNPQAVILTPIGLDHQNILGDTIAEIAFEKSGIIKDNTSVFSFPQVEQAISVIQKTCHERNAPLEIIHPPGSQDYRMENLNFCSQVYSRIFNMPAPEIDPTIRARFEKLSEKPLVIFDSAHNVPGMLNLGQLLVQYYRNYNIMIHINCLAERSLSDLLVALTSTLKKSQCSFETVLFDAGPGFYTNFEQEGLYSQNFDAMLKTYPEHLHLVTGSMRLYQAVDRIMKQQSA
ncbi:MAG: hypothetical protein KDK41_14960 [Leptospiraceae bacterium]|nr:hypothetical protein [Leptospiraceae bacterium]